MREGWEIKKLGEVCDVVGGSTPKTTEGSFWGGEFYWISPAELDGSKYVYSTLRTITSDGVKNAHLQMLPVGTVLLSSRAPIGKVAITKVPMYCNQGFKNFICGPDLNPVYMYYLLRLKKEYFIGLGSGTTFKELSRSVIEKISISVPPIETQNVFERLYKQTDKSKYIWHNTLNTICVGGECYA